MIVAYLIDANLLQKEDEEMSDILINQYLQVHELLRLEEKTQLNYVLHTFTVISSVITTG